MGEEKEKPPRSLVCAFLRVLAGIIPGDLTYWMRTMFGVIFTFLLQHSCATRCFSFHRRAFLKRHISGKVSFFLCQMFTCGAVMVAGALGHGGDAGGVVRFWKNGL